MSKPQATGVVKIVPTGMQKTAATIKKGFADIGRQVGQAMKGAAIAGMAGAAAGIVATIKNGLDQKVLLEQSETLMASLMGGADKAREAMAMLSAEAQKNPMFSRRDLVQTGAALSVFANGSSKQLQGLVQTAQKLSLLKPEQGLEGAAFALKEALGGDFVSLASRFDIPRSSINALREAGFEGKALIDALLKGQGITDSTMADMTGTVGGQLATMRSMWDEISVEIVEGFWPRIQASAQEFLGWIVEKKDTIVSLLTVVTETAMTLFKWIVTGVDYLIRGVQMFGSFLGAWWSTITQNFSLENFVAWVKEMGMAGLEVTRGLIYKLAEMVLSVLKEYAPRLFNWLGGDEILKDLQFAADESFGKAGNQLHSANERAGVNAGAMAAIDEWDRQEKDRAKSRRDREALIQQMEAKNQPASPQQATLRVDVQGFNLPPMMGAS